MRILILFSLILLATDVLSQELIHPTSDGTAYVSGKDNSKQIFIKRNNVVYQLSKFKNWEKIESLYIDEKEKHLIAYHKADKENHYRITLYDLDKRIQLAETAPGMMCLDIKWFSDKILFFSGTTGGGTYIYIYDQSLTKLNVINSPGIHVNIKEGICFSYPVYGAEGGAFTLYDLSTGKEKMTFDFMQQTNENYVCTAVMQKGPRNYQLTLETVETNRKLTVEKTFE